ncbi:Zinc metalloproteinase nas-4 [Armadillidium vulgare]|nr:Zinc metalloproteinase nas-4 [Armadillidium vulgare]
MAKSAEDEASKPKRLGNPDEWGGDFQGDIKLSSTSRNGLRSEEYRWPNGVVPYTFAPNFPASKRDVVLKAMDHYKYITNGCIQFKERTTEPDFVAYTDNDEGCYSFIGKQGGRQVINLPTWCTKSFGSVLHEMYHALGFFHEQSRTDRDDFVNINWDNIEEGMETNFNLYGPDVTNDFSTDYDYGSLMHYSPYAFSTNGEKTIETKDKSYSEDIGQRVELSENDVQKLLKMYNCP